MGHRKNALQATYNNFSFTLLSLTESYRVLPKVYFTESYRVLPWQHCSLLSGQPNIIMLKLPAHTIWLSNSFNFCWLPPPLWRSCPPSKKRTMQFAISQCLKNFSVVSQSLESFSTRLHPNGLKIWRYSLFLTFFQITLTAFISNDRASLSRGVERNFATPCTFRGKRINQSINQFYSHHKTNYIYNNKYEYAWKHTIQNRCQIRLFDFSNMNFEFWMSYGRYPPPFSNDRQGVAGLRLQLYPCVYQARS